MVHGDSKIEEVRDLASKLNGAAWAFRTMPSPDQRELASTLLAACNWLEKLSQHMCGAGFIGCNGGRDCGSDHK